MTDEMVKGMLEKSGNKFKVGMHKLSGESLHH